MNKTLIIVLVVALVLLATPFLSTASACVRQTKETFTLTTIGMGTGGITTKYGNIAITRGESNADHFVEVDVGTNAAIYPDPQLLTSSVDSIMNIVTGAGYDYLTETIVFADGSTIVFHAFEHFTGCVPPYTSFSGAGSFDGHGTGALSGVRVWGTTSFYISFTQGGMVSTCSGTVMGWPT